VPSGCTIRSKEPSDLDDLIKEADGLMESDRRTMESASLVAGNTDRAAFAAPDKGGGADSLRESAERARNAIAGLAADAEVLKHNVFLRLLPPAGYSNLDNLAAGGYYRSQFAMGSAARRAWLGAAVFTLSDEVSEAGKAAPAAVAAFGVDVHNAPAVVEGHADCSGRRFQPARATAQAESQTGGLDSARFVAAEAEGQGVPGRGRSRCRFRENDAADILAPERGRIWRAICFKCPIRLKLGEN
jgi:hypothetical protein